MRVRQPPDFLGQLADLRSTWIVVGHFFYPVVRLLPDAVMATVIRDPVERSISVWEYLQWQTRHAHHHVLGSRGIRTVDELAEDPFLAGHVRNNQARQLGVEYDVEGIVAALEAGEIEPDEARHLTTEAERAPVEPELLLARAKQRLRDMTLVGVTEELPAFVRRLELALGLPTGPSVEPDNVTPATKVALRGEVYDENTRRRLADLNALDVELYAFARELCGAQRDRAASGD